MQVWLVSCVLVCDCRKYWVFMVAEFSEAKLHRPAIEHASQRRLQGRDRWQSWQGQVDPPRSGFSCQCPLHLYTCWVKQNYDFGMGRASLVKNIVGAVWKVLWRQISNDSSIFYFASFLVRYLTVLPPESSYLATWVELNSSKQTRKDVNFIFFNSWHFNYVWHHN